MIGKHVRVALAGLVLLLLCGGCWGNCFTRIIDDIFSGSRYSTGGSTYLIEVDAGVSDAGSQGDGGD